MSRRGMQVKALLSMGILVGFGTVSTLAAWTGTATATSTISAATVSLGVGKTASDASTYTVPLDSTDWYPGMSQVAMVTVKNTGSLAVPYTIAGSVTESGGGSLGDALSVRVVPDGVADGSAHAATCRGTEVLTKPALDSFPPAVDRPSLAAPGGSETLCVQYSLPTNADNALQGKSTSVKLTFTATVGS
jgi:hypothetical protein